MAGKKEMLELKLQVELENPSKLFSRSSLEDIYSVLTLNEWSDEVMLKLINAPDLLQEIARTLHNDDAVSEFLEQRTRELILEFVTE